ncbi:protein HEAT INTOLERANT 4-like [Malus sylvestris]|uniref:protein HEAT INTOLERANT 4-like n=1 Tax=Malus sylvestris TaxID=3752 RepID=UPI0021ABDC3D|nr:protein HEAT INTOLERANT 4-like [Malus sylvestris]
MRKEAGGSRKRKAAREINMDMEEADRCSSCSSNSYMPDTRQQQPLLKRMKRTPSRNMEDLWKAAFPVGTAWDDQLESVYNHEHSQSRPWDFSNLEQAFEDGGKFCPEIIGEKNKVYLFGTTEEARDSDDRVVLIPLVLAIVSPSPPSHDLGFFKSKAPGDGGDEDFIRIPMKKMKMDWLPYIPLDKRNTQVHEIAMKKSPPNIFVLGCTQRRAALKRINEDRFMKFQYSVPCLDYDHKAVKEEEENRSGYETKLNWLKEFLLEQVIQEDEFLAAEKKEPLVRYVREQLLEARREAKNRQRIARDKKIYKFYPLQTPDFPRLTVQRSPYISFYRLDAHEVL